MAENTLSPAELNQLVEQFQKIENEQEKARFYHENPPLHPIFRHVHFPKPVEPVKTN